jgi:hypothetical protein
LASISQFLEWLPASSDTILPDATFFLLIFRRRLSFLIFFCFFGREDPHFI